MGFRVSENGGLLPRSENQIKNDILEFLSFFQNDIEFWRQNNGAVYDPKIQSFRRKSKYEKNGISDILGFFKSDGRFLAIEVKKPGGKLSPEQLRFLNSVNASGGIGICAYSIDDVMARLGSPSALQLKHG